MTALGAAEARFQMQIVHVVRQFHPGVGGLETVVLELASAQLADGNRVRVVTLDRLFKSTSGQRLPAKETLNGIEIVRIPYFGSSRYPMALFVLRHIKDADLVHVHAIDFFFDYLAWTKPLHRPQARGVDPWRVLSHGLCRAFSSASGFRRLRGSR